MSAQERQNSKNEKPTAWKHKEIFQEGDLLSIIIYELASSYFNVDGLHLSFRDILKSEKKKKTTA